MPTEMKENFLLFFFFFLLRFWFPPASVRDQNIVFGGLSLKRAVTLITETQSFVCNVTLNLRPAAADTSAVGSALS